MPPYHSQSFSMQSHCGECLVKAAAGEPWSPLSESVLAAAILRILFSELAERVSFRVLRAQQLRPGGTHSGCEMPAWTAEMMGNNSLWARRQM